MKYLSILAALLMSSNDYAQNISWFSINNIDYYQANKFAPGSIAEFYSSISGGTLLFSQIVDKNGSVVLKENSKSNPKMVLNRGILGSKQVSFFTDREFALKTPNLLLFGNKATLSWEANVSNESDTYFEIYKSVDGKNFVPISQINSIKGDGLLAYQFADVLNGDLAYYKLVVLSKLYGLRYTSYPLIATIPNSINVYPSNTQNDIYISIPSVDIIDNNYVIINNNGQKLISGHLVSGINSLSLSNLPCGNYFVNVYSGNDHKIFNVTKY